MKKRKQAKHSSILKKRHLKKPAESNMRNAGPIPHCNTYGQWVSESRRMIEEAKGRK